MNGRELLAAEVALLAAETNYLTELVNRGILPEGARRQPTIPELRAGVRFAELDRIILAAAALIVRHTDAVRDHVLDGLALGLGSAGDDPWETLALLDAYRDPTSGVTIPGLRDVVTDTADVVTDNLVEVAGQGAAEVIGEATRQGLPAEVLPELDATANPATRAAAQAHAARIAQAPATRLLNVAAEAGQRAATLPGATGQTVAAAALDAAELVDRAGVEDLARQGANVTHGLGRTEALTAFDTPPSEVYASELLDRNTCGPCDDVDGRTYATLEDGLVDYPGAGGYVGCEGGSRCRGSLIVVHGTEAPPTLDNPGDGSGGPHPTDRTPQGPSGVDRPHYIDESGNIIPTPPDKGTPSAPDVLTATIDDTGTTVMPVDQLEPPVETVAPGDVDRDPEFATYSDDELDRVLVDDTVDVSRRMAAADELDQRAAGTRAQVWQEEALDAATLARYEAEREAWEAAGGYAADAVTTGIRTAGRRIDRVRDEWTGDQHMAYLAAEDATRGVLIRADRLAEYTAKYGSSTAALFDGPARVAYYYASRELRDHWDTLPGGRPSFAEYAVARGVADAKMTARAKSAAAAREEGRRLADESAAGRAKRAAQRAETKRRKGPLTAGERLAQEQRRRDRIRAQERRRAADLGDLPDPPTVGES